MSELQGLQILAPWLCLSCTGLESWQTLQMKRLCKRVAGRRFQSCSTPKGNVRKENYVKPLEDHGRVDSYVCLNTGAALPARSVYG